MSQLKISTQYICDRRYTGNWNMLRKATPPIWILYSTSDKHGVARTYVKPPPPPHRGHAILRSAANPHCLWTSQLVQAHRTCYVKPLQSSGRGLDKTSPVGHRDAAACALASDHARLILTHHYYKLNLSSYDSDDPDDPIVTSTLRHRDDPDISDMGVLLMSRDVGIGERCIMVTRSRIYIRRIG